MKTGQELRDEALDKLEDTTPETWLDEAYAAIAFLVRERDLFTADSVWDLVGPTREPRAMGVVFRRAVKDGLVKPTKSFWSSTRAKRHAGPVRVWQAVR